MRDTSPCYECTKHNEACHATCEGYAKWVDKKAEEKKAAKKYYDANAHVKDVADAIRRKLHMRGGGQK